jgi:hypothetical protein
MTDLPAPQPETQIAAPEPATKARRPWLVPVIIAAGAVVLLGAGAGIGYAVVVGQRSPEAVVSSYLNELVAGDAAAAGTWMTALPEGNPVLLQPDTYAGVTDPISDFTVIDTDIDGKVAEVTVEFVQGSETYTQELTLSLIKRDLGIFDVWRVDGSNLPGVYVSFARPDGMDLSVNGTDFGVLVGSYEYDVPALPGTYTFTPEGTTEFYTAEPVTVTIRFDGPESTTSVALPVTLTEAGAASAQAAVNAYLDSCLAQPVLAPSGNCGFSIAQDDGTYTNIRWTLLVRPTVSFGDYRSGRGWAVIPEAPGSMRLDADYELPGEYGTAEGTISGFKQAGFVLVDEAGVATFESVIYE